MLFTKSIFAPKEISDGIRISVMSRHTLNDGVTLDSRITEDSYDEWLQALAPPAKLVGAHYHRNLSWENFGKRYRIYLDSNGVKPLVIDLAERALIKDLTLLCVEENAYECHRGFLADVCKFYKSELIIEHR